MDLECLPTSGSSQVRNRFVLGRGHEELKLGLLPVRPIAGLEEPQRRQLGIVGGVHLAARVRFAGWASLWIGHCCVEAGAAL